MADVNVKTFLVDVTDWNGVRQVQQHTPQNWSVKALGPLNAENLQKFLAAQWPARVQFHSVKEVEAVVDREAFVANRTSPEARPRVVEQPKP